MENGGCQDGEREMGVIGYFKLIIMFFYLIFAGPCRALQTIFGLRIQIIPFGWHFCQALSAIFGGDSQLVFDRRREYVLTGLTLQEQGLRFKGQ